jgi:hypothetical protein
MTPFQPIPSQNTPDQNDQTITRVLHAFRDAPAPTGLEARVLQNLQQRQLASPPSHTLWTRLAPWRWALTIAIPATAIFLIALTHKAHIIPIPSPVDALNQPSTYSASPTTNPNQTTAQAPALNPTHVLSATIHPRPATFTPPSAPQLSTPLSPQDQLALEETNAPSLATPPMPLTAQERLLLRAARPGSAIEVAELDQLREPILRAASAARDRANLQRYASGLIAPLLTFQNLAPSTPDTPPPATDDAPPPPR